MDIVLRIVPNDDPDDPIETIASPLDKAVIPGPLSKEQREDLQMRQLQLALQATAPGTQAITVTLGADPPDRVVTIDGMTVGVELTELTLSDIREDLARARRFGRALEDRLQDRHRFGHLFGRRTSVSIKLPEFLQCDHKALLESLYDMLSEDRGYFGEGLDLSKGMPSVFPTTGRYLLGPLEVFVFREPGLPGTSAALSATTPTKIQLSELLSALHHRVAAKDLAGNDVLVMSCGLPDQRGYTCPSDYSIFRLLRDHVHRVQLRPQHVKAVLVHMWPGPEVLSLFRRPGEELHWPPDLGRRTSNEPG